LSESDVRAILDRCIEDGWSINDHGKISYFIGNFDWLSSNVLNWNKVKEEIINGFIDKEITGLSIIYTPEDTGGDLLFINSQEIIFSISINAKNTNNEGADFEYYLDILKYILGEILIDKVEFLW